MLNAPKRLRDSIIAICFRDFYIVYTYLVSSFSAISMERFI